MFRKTLLSQVELYFPVAVTKSVWGALESVNSRTSARGSAQMTVWFTIQSEF